MEGGNSGVLWVQAWEEKKGNIDSFPVTSCCTVLTGWTLMLV